MLRSSYHEEHLPTLGTLAVPTLVTVGERDSPRFQMGAELLHGWIPNSRLVRVAGAGHTPHSERPVSFCCHVLDFLADVDKQGATSGTPG